MFGDDDDDLPLDDTPEGTEGDEPLDDETPPEDNPPPDDETPPPEGDDEPAPRSAKAPKGKTPKATTPSPAPPRQPQTVPLATFLQEKTKFTEALDRERTEREKLRQELEALKNPPKAPPKFSEDPEGFIDHKTKESAKTVLEKLEEHGKKIGEVAEANKLTAEQRAEQEFIEDLDRSSKAFAAQTPDYYEALFHVRQIAYAQLKEYYPDATDEQIMGAIAKQELTMARESIKAGRNPHERAYRLAQINGYAKKDPAPTPKKKPNGKAPAKVTPPIDDDDGEEVLDPELSLGRSNGEAPEDDDDDVPDPNEIDPFEDAMKEVFGRRRRA